MSIKVVVEFCGGLEVLFEGTKKHNVTVTPAGGVEEAIIADLLQVLKDEYFVDGPELFFQGDTVRPGILVLINGTDWEVLDGIDAPIAENDVITFVSTLHGG